VADDAGGDDADGDVAARPDESRRNVIALRPPMLSSTEYLLHLTVEANTRMAEHVIQRFGGMMGSGAQLIRAADGAGMPARPPAMPELRNAEAGSDDDESVPASNTTWPDIIGKCLPYVDLAVGALVDRRIRNAGRPGRSQAKERTTAPVERNDASAERTETSSQSATAPDITPEMRAHFMAIYQQLTPEEGALAREIAGEMTSDELADWMFDLSALSVDDATAKVKAKLAELTAREPATEESAS
jgi:hypothetical protein